MNLLQNWVRTKELLLCVDSDGCAMNTMDIKHKTCFGPLMIDCYGLAPHREQVQALWEEINLYRITRGINRFQGLVSTLKAVRERDIASVPEFDRLEEWTKTTKELSNPALEREIERTGDPQLALALKWSRAVNEAISALPEEHGAYPGVKSALARLGELADISVVSSANGGALKSEWSRCELEQYISALLGQECGSKALCISELLRIGGYEREHTLMVGDALGDMKAAEKNGVFFYPILVGKEKLSWERLCDEAVPKLADGTFTAEYQEQLKKEFYENLS